MHSPIRSDGFAELRRSLLTLSAKLHEYVFSAEHEERKMRKSESNEILKKCKEMQESLNLRVHFFPYI